MKTYKKIFGPMLILFFAFVMVGCDNSENLTPSEGEYIFEAEGIDMAGLSGHGYSNEASEVDMILGQNTKNIRENESVLKSISNGYFIGFFTSEGTTLTFNINADKASTNNTLILRLGSEFGTMKIDPNSMTIKVNGVELDYDQISVRGKKLEGLNIKYDEPFRDYEVSVPFDLKLGDNKIELTILKNKLGIENTAVESVGPGVDYIKIKSDSILTWDSLWESNFEENKVEE
jgi:hypothetical protein